MAKKVFCLFFLYLFLPVFLYAKEADNLETEVISINTELEFFIIRAGEDKAIKINDGVTVFREKRKIAEGHIIEVRSNVSAAEITNLGEGEKIKEKDIALVTKAGASKASRQLLAAKTGGIPVKSVASPLDSAAALGPREVLTGVPITGNIISVNVKDSSFEKVFGYARLVLQENGYSIIESNRASGIIAAQRPINLSIIKELWSDAVASIDHRLLLTLEIKSKQDMINIRASLFKEHFQKGKYIKKDITKGSKYGEYYRETVNLLKGIKQRAED